MRWRKGELIRETKWSRLYRTGPKDEYYESKFLLDGVRAEPSSIKREWDNLSAGEKLDFALAFAAGAAAALSPDGEEILSFLMKVGPEEVWVNIASVLPRHSDKESVLHFLLERIRSSQGPGRINYYDALMRLKDQKAVPILRQDYERRLERINDSSAPAVSEEEWEQFFSCCAALWRLGADGPFEARLREALSHPSPIVRSLVGQLLEK